MLLDQVHLRAVEQERDLVTLGRRVLFNAVARRFVGSAGNHDQMYRRESVVPGVLVEVVEILMGLALSASIGLTRLKFDPDELFPRGGRATTQEVDLSATAELELLLETLEAQILKLPDPLAVSPYKALHRGLIGEREPVTTR